jgi:hypothetical protein
MLIPSRPSRETGFRHVIFKRFSEFKGFYDAVKTNLTTDQLKQFSFPSKRMM